MTAIAIQKRDEILKRIASGERVGKIARDIGYSGHAGLTNLLRNDPDYKAALEAGLEARLDAAEEAIEAEHRDQVTVSRARAMHAAATWRCEREASGRWGQRPDASVSVQVVVQQFVAGEQHIQQLPSDSSAMSVMSNQINRLPVASGQQSDQSAPGPSSDS